MARMWIRKTLIAIVAGVAMLYFGYGVLLYSQDLSSRLSMHICPPDVQLVVSYAYSDTGLVAPAYTLPDCPRQKLELGQEVFNAPLLVLGWPVLMFSHRPSPETLTTPVPSGAENLRPTPQELSLSEPVPVPDLPGEFKAFPDGAYELRVPSWWHSVDTTSYTRIPYEFSGVKYALKSEKYSCALLYAEDPKAAYIQTSPIDSLLVGQSAQDSGNAYFGARRDILTAYARQNHATTTPGLFEVDTNPNAPYKPYEFASFTLGGGPAFRLVSTSEQPMPPQCESEIRSILKTYTRKFADTVLSENSSGFITVSDSTSGAAPHNTQLLYIPAGLTEVPKSLHTFSQAPRQITFSQQRQTLYFLPSQGDHRGIFEARFTKTGSLDVHPWPENSDAVFSKDDLSVIDFLIAEDKVYYLLGPAGCMEYMGKCQTQLYEYTLTNKSVRLIVSNLDLSSFAAASADGKVLLMARHFGDGGCWSSQYARVNILDSSVLVAGTFSGCYEDDGAQGGNEAQLRGRDALVAQFTGASFSKENVYQLTIHNGAFQPLFESGPWEQSQTLRMMTQFHVSPYPIRIMRE